MWPSLLRTHSISRIWRRHIHDVPLRIRVREEVQVSKTYTVAEGREFDYPADSLSLHILKTRGGRSKLTTDDLEAVKFKQVKSGEDCSDMPPDTLALFLERGWVICNE